MKSYLQRNTLPKEADLPYDGNEKPFYSMNAFACLQIFLRSLVAVSACWNREIEYKLKQTIRETK